MVTLADDAPDARAARSRWRARARLSRDELGVALREHALLEGDFVLRSGRRSRYYLDKYRFETRPELLGPLGERLAAAAREHEPDAVRLAGPALGAVALAAAASLASGLPFVIVRDAAKEYGTANRLEGPFEPGEHRLPDRGRRHLRRRARRGGRRRSARPGSTCATPSASSIARRAEWTRSRVSASACARSSGPATSSRPRQAPQNRMVEPEPLRQSDPAVRVAAGFRTSHEQEESQVTKQEFVDAVASKANLSRRDAGARWTRSSTR